ncbi:DUF4157 domain-containing protein [Pseudomonas sp. COW5]|uniref:eCIS core domain-containing protein n=1 Tax=Pseudomonas sp. COW5 TaxID=2981253 RepID=UPI0022456469|nr:DUF4157 domain-containing protein [Pseudomonas sp. COW5]MCX2545816.1 DUF4157 domain-containing protein [Pseudomonas sp. COW5]
MKTMLRMYVGLIVALALSDAQASWLSEITGIDIDVNRGSVSIKPPNINAIPPMIQNLPKDVGQAMLNPVAPVLAEAIRLSRSQALNRGTQPIPDDVKNKLSPYFPPGILNKVSWTTAGGISLDGALKNWFDQEGAITYDDVIVFANVELTRNVELWAHELTHTLQYNQMGIDTFAFQYSYDWNGLESQARSNAGRIYASIQSTDQGNQQTWSYNGAASQTSQQINWTEINQAARQAIQPQQCIWIDNNSNTTGNLCPVPIVVSGVILRRLMDGYTFQFPCNAPTCIFGPGQSGPLLSPPGHLVVGVAAAYQWQ